jgi:asparagine synthetase B (glutamine-hydrolysing)
VIDYLLSRDRSQAAELRRVLQAIRAEEARDTVQTWQGDWGCLVAIGPAYSGCEPFEDTDSLMLVLGGPRFRQGERLPGESVAVALLQRWQADPSLSWFADLVGPYQLVCIDKPSGRVAFITDVAAFVPAYHSRRPDGNHCVGSHADAVALATGVAEAVDPVAVADFLRFQTVTVPHTLYAGVRQLPAAAISTLADDDSLDTVCYWQPAEPTPAPAWDSAVAALGSLIPANVATMTAGLADVGVLMSGGEDSRVVLSSVPAGVRARAVTVADWMNHEANVARRVAIRLGADWELVTRSPTHYLDHIESSIRLAESHNFFYHAHFNGYPLQIGRARHWLGGLMADALCKGSHVRKHKRLGIVTGRYPEHWEYRGTDKLLPLPPAVAAAVQERRAARNAELATLRPDSWAEWHSLYPASMNTNSTNYFVSRRLFASLEPFADARVVQLSAAVPQRWKLNRRLFRRAMLPVLRRTRWMAHANGLYPYLPQQFNGPWGEYLHLLQRAKRRLKRAMGRAMPNQGPWPVWARVVATPRFAELRAQNDAQAQARIVALLGEDMAQTLEHALASKDPVQALAGLQMHYWLRNLPA